MQIASFDILIVLINNNYSIYTYIHIFSDNSVTHLSKVSLLCHWRNASIRWKFRYFIFSFLNIFFLSLDYSGLFVVYTDELPGNGKKTETRSFIIISIKKNVWKKYERRAKNGIIGILNMNYTFSSILQKKKDEEKFVYFGFLHTNTYTRMNCRLYT